MKKLLALILCIIITAKSGNTENKTEVNISGNLNESFFINFPTPEGIHSFKFNIIDSKKYLAVTDDSDGLFFKGHQLRETINKNNPRASANIIDGLLQVNFLGRRTGRPFLLSVDVRKTRKAYSGYLAHVSNSVELGCATAEVSARFTNKEPDSTPKTQSFRELTISVDADNSYFKSFIRPASGKKSRSKGIQNSKKKTIDAVRTVFNTVNSIYSEQLGILIILSDVKVDTSGERSINSKDSEIVLDSFRNNVKKLKHLAKADLYHLFTANKMNGSVVGLAYVGIACRRDLEEYSVGLSRLTNPVVQPLITAHEIAHNLGATHADGDDSIMSPVLSGAKNKFIPLSVGQILGYVNDFGVCMASVLK